MAASSSSEDVDEVPSSDDKGEIAEYVHKGNDLYRRGKYNEAICAYSKVYQKGVPHSGILLSNRCAAYCKFNEYLRRVPASVSEENALYGRDPMELAQLALKDAEKLMKLSRDWPKSYLRKGSALLLLEQYEEARATFLSGLKLDPKNVPLLMALSRLVCEEGTGTSAESGAPKRLKLQRCDDFDCTLCLKLLYNPVTTPCGHSFCRACLLQALDHGNKCPMCRTVLFVNPKTYPVSVTLNNVIQRNFAEEYQDRKAEVDGMTLAGNEILPLFVMDFVVPFEKMCLNIFEPRYRLMVRRIMEGNHRMGMVGVDPQTGTIADVCCEVEICECDPLPDGRFLLQVEGRRRCHITKSWEQDGYRVGQVQSFQDKLPPNGSEENEELVEMAKTAREMATSLISHIQTADHHSRVAELLLRAEGMPDISDVERFSFWVTNLVSIRSSEKLELLRLTNTQTRLARGISRLRAIGNQGGCRVQ
ncbi:LON peptidase N-terminal domain and RING finger protein 1-like isoform X1 [Selaginella moellendorffii]|uniref:LON peptidase N-terminal domain and RING finger protein 1-like isoform X1 n=1 Tax=Selaginella moellendorffii TaxID=88036 RepID=UPI000D1CC439|nr:LON peptidase N-terminal domain and RING finger protein 1-like isoform X1 [Selaginella moellendorffii]|eukprot:XP_024524849.1 LON peptidase N-terminal domain and RING finger protein 1-like isoform X1 [Selaginella moellendorffii]